MTTNSKPILVAFTGLAQAGKTTAAQAFLSLGYDRMSFADPIKAMVRCLTPVTDKLATPQELCGKSLREVYQSLGTDWGRNMVGGDIWIRAGRFRIETLLSDVLSGVIRGVVIDDIRFDNEAELIRNMGGTVVEITRPNSVQMDHASEAGVSRHLIDHTFSNHTDVDSLKCQVLGKLYYGAP
jgi:dephospho-CoA kinase